MNQMTLSFEEAISTICEVAGNLNYPESIRIARDSSHLDSSRGQLDEEENDKARQSLWRPHLDGEKVGRDDLVKMSAEKLFPRCFSVPLRRRFDTVLFQNISNRLVCQYIAQIDQCSLDAAATPASILLARPYG